MSPLRYEVDPATMVDPEPKADTSAMSTSRGPATAPAARPSLLKRYRGSVWVPVAAKASGIALLMLGLAGIGATSILSTPGGLPLSAAALSAKANGNWLAALAASPSGAVWMPPERERIAATDQGSGTSLAAGRTAPREASSSETSPSAAGQTGSGGAPDAELRKTRAAGITPDGKVILNTATAKELTRLPGVGAKRALSILKLRERLKRFRRPTDLLRVRGIGVRSLRRMLPHLILDPPNPPAKEDPR